jgi:two-component system, cell cycle response regulator DivK
MGGGSVERPHVLIVEDEPDNREVVRVVVEEILGCRAVTAVDGLEAVAKASEHLPDLILLDMMLPGLTGYEVCRQLKDDPRTRNIPIVALTAMARAEDRALAMDVGCVDFIDKPFELDALEEKIRSRIDCDEGG